MLNTPMTLRIIEKEIEQYKAIYTKSRSEITKVKCETSISALITVKTIIETQLEKDLQELNKEYSTTHFVGYGQ